MENKNLLNKKGLALSQTEGFTIIELVVVMAVFLFIVGASLGIFISVIQSQKRVLAEQQMLNQISYVNEYMSKALRMAKTDEFGVCLGLDNAGYIYLLTGSITTNTGTFFTGIKFVDQNGDCREFFVDTNSYPWILEDLNSTKDTDAVALTSTGLQLGNKDLQNPQNDIPPVRFAINGNPDNCMGIPVPGCGASNQEYYQPRVTFVFNIKIPGDKETRAIQTTVGQRNLNVDPEGTRQTGSCSNTEECKNMGSLYCLATGFCSRSCTEDVDCSNAYDGTTCIVATGVCVSGDSGERCISADGCLDSSSGTPLCIDDICKSGCKNLVECQTKNTDYLSCINTFCNLGVNGDQCINDAECISNICNEDYCE